jgi:hypothetical protein
MSTLQVNNLDSYTGSKIDVDSTADFNIEATTASTSSTSGALRVAGGVSTQTNLNVGGNAIITGTLEASLNSSVLDGGSF